MDNIWTVYIHTVYSYNTLHTGACHGHNRTGEGVGRGGYYTKKKDRPDNTSDKETVA